MTLSFAIHNPRVSYYTGGAERYIINFFIESLKQGKNLFLVTYDAPIKSPWFKELYRIHKKRIILIKSEKLDQIFDKLAIATTPKVWDKESKLFSIAANKYYKKCDFNGISYHYTVDCLNPPFGKRIFLHLHGLPDKPRSIEGKALLNVDKIIALSRYIAFGWKKHHKIRSKINIVTNGIKIARYKKSYSKKIDLIYFGRIIKIKGIDTLIRAVNKLKFKFPNISCVIIGDGPYKPYLEGLVRKYGLENNISFKGKVRDKDLINAISKSKISVFPSFKREGIMTTILESMNYGSLVLASDSCSNGEIINKNNGFLFKPRDSDDLAKNIEYLLNNESLREKTIKNANKNLKEFAWGKQARRVWKVFSL